MKWIERDNKGPDYQTERYHHGRLYYNQRLFLYDFIMDWTNAFIRNIFIK